MNVFSCSYFKICLIFGLLDEWKNFLERMGCENLEALKREGKEEELRKWASFRGQTLSRTGEKL